MKKTAIWAIGIMACTALIANTFVRIDEPKGGEAWVKGTIHSIHWSYNGMVTVTPVTLELHRAGKKVGVIARDVLIGSMDPEHGSYSWEVGKLVNGSAAPGKGYKILIKVQGKPYRDKSDNPFEILPPQ